MNSTCDRYARLLGYKGKKEIVVCDGKITSHDNQDWHEFCEKLRDENKSEWRDFNKELEKRTDKPEPKEKEDEK